MTPIPKELGAEDFGSFTEFAPGAMFTLGTLIEGDERYLHHPRLDLDERALPIGTAILAETALRFSEGLASSNSQWKSHMRKSVLWE